MSKFTEEEREVLREGLKKVKKEYEIDANYDSGENKEKAIRKVYVTEDLEKKIEQ